VTVAAALAHNRALRGLSRAELDAVAFAFCDGRYYDGHVFIDIGTPGRAIHVVVEGEVGVVVREREVVRLGPGALFGLLALVDGAPSSATVLARGTARVGVLSGTAFQLLENTYAPVGRAFRLALGEQVAADFRRLVYQTRDALDYR
jgi:CRP-like cAMP-binding protein